MYGVSSLKREEILDGLSESWFFPKQLDRMTARWTLHIAEKPHFATLHSVCF